VTVLESDSPCALCSGSATTTVEPQRRTLCRGSDPEDPTYSVTVLLPDVALCAGHGVDVRAGDILLGWCDNEHCRIYGEVGVRSPCGRPYESLATSKQ